jgi:hypothetical protein
MAISIEDLIVENIHLAYPYAYEVEVRKVDDNHYTAKVIFWQDNDVNLRITVSDEEEITEIEDSEGPIAYHAEMS